MTRYRRRLPIISALLLALVARAAVPVGFMPAADGSAQMTLCPDGMLMPADAGNAGAGRLHTDHCPYGSAPFTAPIADRPDRPRACRGNRHTHLLSLTLGCHHPGFAQPPGPRSPRLSAVR